MTFSIVYFVLPPLPATRPDEGQKFKQQNMKCSGDSGVWVFERLSIIPAVKTVFLILWFRAYSSCSRMNVEGQCCGFGMLSRIPDLDFYRSRIPDPTTPTKQEGKIYCPTFFVATNVIKFKIILFLNI